MVTRVVNGGFSKCVLWEKKIRIHTDPRVQFKNDGCNDHRAWKTHLRWNYLSKSNRRVLPACQFWGRKARTLKDFSMMKNKGKICIFHFNDRCNRIPVNPFKYSQCAVLLHTQKYILNPTKIYYFSMLVETTQSSKQCLDISWGGYCHPHSNFLLAKVFTVIIVTWKRCPFCCRYDFFVSFFFWYEQISRGLL